MNVDMIGSYIRTLVMAVRVTINLRELDPQLLDPQPYNQEGQTGIDRLAATKPCSAHQPACDSTYGISRETVESIYSTATKVDVSAKDLRPFSTDEKGIGRRKVLQLWVGRPFS